MIITDLAVFQRADHHSPFRLVELAPGSRATRSGPKPRRSTTNDRTDAERVALIAALFGVLILLYAQIAYYFGLGPK